MSQNPRGSLHVKVITSSSLLAEEEASDASLPSVDGLLGILPGHRPLLVALGRGELTIKSGEATRRFAVRGGYAEVRSDRVLVFTEEDRHESDEFAEG